MGKYGLDVIILTNPANMFYLTGDGRLCAYAMVTREGKIAVGVPQTDVEDVKAKATLDDIVGFEDEVGMIHSLARDFEGFGIRKGTLGLEYAFLPKPRIGMLTHPHGKPEAVDVKDCTAMMSELRLVKDDAEIVRLQAAARVADAGMGAAVRSIKIGMTESQIAAEAEYAMRYAGAEDFYKTYVASGPRTNIAHGIPTGRKIEKGDLVMIDLHPVVDGYTADLCRTVCIDEPTEAQQRAFDLYVQALKATISKARGGVEMAALELTMHDLLSGRRDTFHPQSRWIIQGIPEKLGALDSKNLRSRPANLSEMFRNHESDKCDRGRAHHRKDPQAPGIMGSKTPSTSQSETTTTKCPYRLFRFPGPTL